MALQTAGFQLSALPRAPDVPQNIGKIDVQAIYDAVQRGLQTQEQIRMGAPRQSLELAQNATAQDQARAQQALIPSATTLALAQNTEGAAREPITTETAGLNRNILASNADPALLAALNAGKIAESETAVGNAAFLNQPGMRQKQFNLTLAKLTPAPVRTISQLYAMLEDPATPEEQKAAIRIQLQTGLTANQGAPGIEAAGQKTEAQKRAEAKVALETAPTIAGAKTAAEEEAKAKVALSTAGQIAGAKATAEETAKLQADRQQKLPKAQSTLKALEDKTALVDRTIEEAKALVNEASVGFGSILSSIPKTDARALKAKLDTIRSNIGFDALAEMRQNSPTGGALGNVSDYEGKTLQATIASLDTGLSTDEFLAALDRVKTTRDQTLARVRDAYQRDFDVAGGDAAALAPQALPTVTTQKDFDALPPGAAFLTPSGQTRHKP